MITSDTDSPLVAFIKAQVPIAERLADGVRVDHATLCALLAAHEAWAGTHRPCPTGTVEPLEADVTAVAALFKRSRSWVYLQLRHGRFPGAYVDRRGAHRFPQSCLDGFIAAERVAMPATAPAAVAGGSRTPAAQQAPALETTAVVTATASATSAPVDTAAEMKTGTASAAPPTQPGPATTATTPDSTVGPRAPRTRATASNAAAVPATRTTLTWDAWRAGRAAAEAGAATG